MTMPISGIAKIVTETAPCFAILIKESDGTAVATVTCAANGTYTFPAQPAGNYAIAFIDPAGQYRGEVIHVLVAP